MMEQILVCPFHEKLLSRLKQRTLVIKTNEFEHIRNITREVNKTNYLHAIQIRTEKPFSSIAFTDEWLNSPMAIYSPDFGNFQSVIQQISFIRKFNLRVFLSSRNEFNYTGLRILSSLDVSCGLYFNEESYQWDLLNDLMHYAMYGRSRRALIEPFGWISRNYEPAAYTDYSTVYFNNPARYLHMNENEQIALTENDLLNNNFIDEGIDALDSIHDNKKYLDFLNARYETMLQMNECAFCPAFRICLAKFSEQPNKNETCKSFFSDLLDAADYSYLKRTNSGRAIWQL
jgi:hypothetical protein